MNSLVCTFYERRYAFGVGALINSLHAADFRGRVHVGHRGPKPAWIGQCTRISDTDYRVGNIDIHFALMEDAPHFSNYKPQLMLKLLDEQKPDELSYFDPDIVMRGPWKFISDWSAEHVALVVDIMHCFPATHPLRIAWQRYFSPHGISPVRPCDHYVNAGFLSLRPAHRPLLEVWSRLHDLMGPALGGLDKGYFFKDRTFLFHTADQDILNYAISCSDVPVSMVGPEGMDFIPGGYLMSHATGQPKPWDKRFIRSALGGAAPSRQDKAYWQYVTAPIRLYGGMELLRRRAALKTGAMIGRFIQRR